MRIHEAGHHHRTPAIDGLGLQPPRLCVQTACLTNSQDAGPLGQYRAIGDDSKLRKGFSTPGTRQAREGEQLLSMAEEE
jgi:hypothetical protein